MFYCREEELRTMGRRYEKGRFECIVIYGRRRVGKTALINEFCKGKPTVYFAALNASSGSKTSDKDKKSKETKDKGDNASSSAGTNGNQNNNTNNNSSNNNNNNTR